MEHWNILEIDPTSDLAKIKKAYIRKLKICHPEDNPDGFQNLRAAYEAALEQAKYIDFLDVIEAENTANEYTETMPISDECQKEKEQSPILIKDDPFLQFQPDKEKIAEDLISQFMNRIEELCSSDTLRNDSQQWQKLLEEDIYWNLDIRQTLNYRMLQFLQENYKLSTFKFPAAVWEILNKHFFWLEQERNLYMFFQEDFGDFLMEKIRYSRESYLQYFIRKVKSFVETVKNRFPILPLLCRVVHIVLTIIITIFFILLTLKNPFLILIGFIVYKIFCKFIK